MPWQLGKIIIWWFYWKYPFYSDPPPSPLPCHLLVEREEVVISPEPEDTLQYFPDNQTCSTNFICIPIITNNEQYKNLQVRIMMNIFCKICPFEWYWQGEGLNTLCSLFLSPFTADDIWEESRALSLTGADDVTTPTARQTHGKIHKEISEVVCYLIWN